MNIIPAHETYLQKLIKLFKECFRDDHYFIDYLKENGLRFDVWAESMQKSFTYCLRQKYSYIVVDEHDELIACMLGIDYFKCKEKTEIFNEIFEADKDGKLPYYEGFHKKIEQLEDSKSDVLYIPLMAVRPQYQKQGLATSLLKNLSERFPEYNMVSDVSNKNIIPIFERYGFSVEEIDKDYFYVCRKAQLFIKKKENNK